ncbi:MAG: cytochrome c3 family protein [Saprospiraceae bacterium]|nr:cytochrome c3 family protein [Candidatus Defluviibacterium haderslevense]
MQRLSQIILTLILSVLALNAQSPHGDKLAIDCSKCHSPESWSYNAKLSLFSHDSTDFALFGQHKALDCKSCHQSLKFDEAPTDCNSCHVDPHNQTVGLDCKRCHTSASWIVDNITEIHEQTSFPLTGVHRTVNCNLCHISETNIRFNTAGINCIDCHRNDYERTTSPDHKKNNFSTNCTDCHSLTEADWKTDKVDHSFFPLEQGHSIKDCAQCHLSKDYSNISKNCISCHNQDFQSTNNPNHMSAKFSNDCASCHTLSPGWKPVQYSAHDAIFPIYSGKHKGKWTQCIDCHKNEKDFTSFTCISCHINPETDKVHQKVNAYIYQDLACLACHPTGSADEVFDHNKTQFPLTGMHTSVDCIQCHKNGFKGTSTECVSCHQTDFNNTLNPNHNKLGIGTDCISCHTTEANWNPAKFDLHPKFYPLNGAHAKIANDCIACHKGNYNNNPNTCAECHQTDFDQTTNPNHKAGQFPNDCASCHSENSWVPSKFDHDGLNFPIFSGKHKGKWTQCRLS